jgi:hypothetical protein
MTGKMESKLAAALGLTILFAFPLGAVALKSLQVDQPAAATTPTATVTQSAAITVGKPDRLTVKPVLSRDEQIADGIATFIAYDHSCVTMPAAATRMAYQALETIPLDTFKAATQRVAALYTSMGPAKYCAAIKPIAERAMSNR